MSAATVIKICFPPMKLLASVNDVVTSAFNLIGVSELIDFNASHWGTLLRRNIVRALCLRRD